MGNLFLAVSGLKCASRVLPSLSLEQKGGGLCMVGVSMLVVCIHAS